METQGFWRLCSMLSWIFVFIITFVRSGINAESIMLDKRVFVALAGEDLQIDLKLVRPANQSGGNFKCFDPHNNVIHNSELSQTGGAIEQDKMSVNLRKLESNHSGEYHCKYKSSKGYWVLLVRDEGYREPYSISDYKGVVILGVLTFVLLTFSVAGSVYVFTGHWDNVSLKTESGSTDRRRDQNREEIRSEEVEEDNTDEITASSTSFYASLEPRPRSIYDVLDHSAANREAGQSRARPKSNEPKKSVEQATQNQDGVFESVYENF